MIFATKTTQGLQNLKILKPMKIPRICLKNRCESLFQIFTTFGNADVTNLGNGISSAVKMWLTSRRVNSSMSEAAFLSLKYILFSI